MIAITIQLVNMNPKLSLTKINSQNQITMWIFEINYLFLNMGSKYG